jgi:hypothetical protein
MYSHPSAASVIPSLTYVIPSAARNLGRRDCHAASKRTVAAATVEIPRSLTLTRNDSGKGSE